MEKYTLCSRFGHLIIIKNTMPSNLTYKFNAVPVKISGLFVEIGKLILKCI